MKGTTVQKQLAWLASRPSSSAPSTSLAKASIDRRNDFQQASSTATATASRRLSSLSTVTPSYASTSRPAVKPCRLCVTGVRSLHIASSKPQSSRLAASLSLSSSPALSHSQPSISTRTRLLHITAYRREQNASTSRGSSSADQASKKPTSSEALSSNPSEDQVAPKPSDVSIGEVRRLMRLAVPEKKTLGIALGLLTISSAVSLSVPFTLGRIIDFFTSPSTSSLPVSVPTAAAILAAIFAVGAAANTGRSILMRIAGQRIVMRVREQAYENTLKLDMAKYDLMGHATDSEGKLKEIAAPVKTEVTPEQSSKDSAAVSAAANAPTPSTTPTKASKGNTLSAALSLEGTEGTPDIGVRGVGDVISRLGSDSSIVGESLTRELSEGLRSLATVVVGIGMMVYISAKLTTLMLFIVPPSAIGAVVYGRYLKKLSRRTQKKIGEMIAQAEERLSSVRTVQAFNSVEPKETKAFSKKVHEIFDLSKKEAYASGLFYGGAGFSGNITMLALLSYGGKLVSQGEITVGDLSSLMLYTAYVGGSLVSLTTFFSTIMKGLGAAGRVFELLDAKPSTVRLSEGIKLSPNAPPRTLSFSNVNFSYPSRPSVPILKDFNLTVEKGKSIAVAGGSGSGKSTLVNLLVRFYDPTSGQLRYGNDDIRTFTPESWRERVSMVPQDPALFSQTIAENIAYGKPDATMSEIREAARLANCDFIEDLPLGFDTMVGPRAAQLSGGQRQRIAIARALVRKPSILILDEATSALDAASETLVNEAVRNITSSHSLTTILIAHRLSTLKTADEIAFMQNGRVVERGTYEELAREGTEFWNSVRSQMLGTTVLPVSGKEAKNLTGDSK